jgi:hypothetical protein
MLILKMPHRQIFDTDNQNVIIRAAVVKYGIPLHHCHSTTDYKFLGQFFPKTHNIWNCFGEAYYYKVEPAKSCNKPCGPSDWFTMCKTNGCNTD